MLKQTFASDILPYRHLWDGPAGPYNAFLVTPPRDYGENLQLVIGVGVFAQTPNSPSSIRVFALTNQTYYPSYDYRWWSFDGQSGAFQASDHLDWSNVNYWYAIGQNFDGTLWQVSVIASFRQLDPNTMEPLAGTERNLSDFGVSGNAASVVGDTVYDRVLIAPAASQVLRCHTLSSGALQTEVELAGHPVSVAGEDESRCFVLTDNGLLHLVDFQAGQVINIIRVAIGNAGAICWDRFYKRLLWFDWEADAVDGASQSLVRGYYPVPVATKLTTPIPLTPPRQSRPVTVAMRAIGDVGEPIGGMAPTVTVSGAATLKRAASSTDGNGYSLALLAPTGTGSATVDATLTVDDDL
jgi:hypothetical protein